MNPCKSINAHARVRVYTYAHMHARIRYARVWLYQTDMYASQNFIMHGLTPAHASILHQHRLESNRSFLDDSFFFGPVSMRGIIGSPITHHASRSSFLLANGSYNQLAFASDRSFSDHVSSRNVCNLYHHSKNLDSQFDDRFKTIISILLPINININILCQKNDTAWRCIVYHLAEVTISGFTVENRRGSVVEKARQRQILLSARSREERGKSGPHIVVSMQIGGRVSKSQWHGWYMVIPRSAVVNPSSSWRNRFRWNLYRHNIRTRVPQRRGNLLLVDDLEAYYVRIGLGSIEPRFFGFYCFPAHRKKNVTSRETVKKVMDRLLCGPTSIWRRVKEAENQMALCWFNHSLS